MTLEELRSLSWTHTKTFKSASQVETFFVNDEHRLGMATRVPAKQSTTWWLQEGIREFDSLEELLIAINAREIASMALEVGFEIDTATLDRLARFANLVAEAEREACAKACRSRDKMFDEFEAVEKQLAEVILARGEA
jgi:hypothetical protein